MSLSEIIKHKVLPGLATLNVFTHRVHSRSTLTLTGFQHNIVLPLWSTVDAVTDADSVVRSTTVGVSKTTSVASYCSRYFLTRNGDCKNGNVYLVIGWRAHFQSI